MARTEEGAKQSLIFNVFAGLLIHIPLGTAGLVLKAFAKIAHPVAKAVAALALGGIILGGIVAFRWIDEGLGWVFGAGAMDPSWRIAFKGALFYLFYLLVLLPFFLPVAYFTAVEKERLLKDSGKKREPEHLRMRRDRLRSDPLRSYLGESLSSGKAVYLTNEQRLMHAEVVGSTGTGKSESVLLPLLAHDIKSGRGAIVIDGKGDLELLDRIHFVVKKTGRLADFYFFSLAHPKKSHTYNPLLRGNATELKDKIIGSMVWSEDFYRRMAEQATLTLLNALRSRPCEKGAEEPPPVLFSELHKYLTDFKALKELAEGTLDPVLKADLGKMLDRFDQNHKFLSGLIADLYLTSRSEFSTLMNVRDPAIDLLEAYKRNKIVYFQLNLQGYGETAKRLGRMILQDIRTVSSQIQSGTRESGRHFYPVFVDDASSFLDTNFIDFLNKARAAGFGIMLLHQSLGDLVVRRDVSFQQQVIENTNIKIILRQDDPDSVEKFTKIGGTRRTLISTYQTEQKFIGKDFTGVGSIREGQEFRVEPDKIRALQRGEAVVIWKSPGFHTDHVKLDFFGHPSFAGEFEPIHAAIPEKKMKPDTAPPPGKAPDKASTVAKPPDVETLEKQAAKKEEVKVNHTSWIDAVEHEKLGMK